MLCFQLDFLAPTEQIIFSSQLLISRLKPKKHCGRVVTVLHHEPLMEQPLSLAEATGGQEEQEVDEGRDVLQASTLLKLAFSGKLPLVTLQSSPF